MGEARNTTEPEIPGTSYAVIPYGADIDTTIAGTVKYTEFTSTDYTQMNSISSFIQSQTNQSFLGIIMMIAEWNGVAQYSGTPVSIY